ncbi:M23 family metallopeptidase [Emticicia sp. 17c]|uniref:M23 family metallopeptidase n=1 Tax=Emticicia sp. 17c TaxID=3127704 RepID=UPI00301DD892
MQKRIALSFLLLLVISVLLVPQGFRVPVSGATKASYNQQSYWYYPWGKSGTHKGVDIFAEKGTPVTAATKGLVIYKGVFGMGGNVVLILGPKWRLHYYAHLDKTTTRFLSFVNNTSVIGTVGDSGNAKGKAPHLHYSITTLFPYLWRVDGAPQGWKKMFYLNPVGYLNEALTQH